MTDEERRQQRYDALTAVDERWQDFTTVQQVEDWMRLDDRAFQMVCEWVKRVGLLIDHA